MSQYGQLLEQRFFYSISTNTKLTNVSISILLFGLSPGMFKTLSIVPAFTSFLLYVCLKKDSIWYKK